MVAGVCHGVKFYGAQENINSTRNKVVGKYTKNCALFCIITSGDNLNGFPVRKYGKAAKMTAEVRSKM